MAKPGRAAGAKRSLLVYSVSVWCFVNYKAPNFVIGFLSSRGYLILRSKKVTASPLERLSSSCTVFKDVRKLGHGPCRFLLR